MNIYRRLILATALIFTSNMAFATEDEIYTKLFSSLGAGGYDVVAYFSAAKPVEGSDNFSTAYKDADWNFSSQANLDEFKSNPDKYVPQYGGYCAWAVAQGELYSGDPLQWTVLNDKLYLNYDAEVQVRWTADSDNLIVKADTQWPNILN